MLHPEEGGWIIKEDMASKRELDHVADLVIFRTATKVYKSCFAFAFSNGIR